LELVFLLLFGTLCFAAGYAVRTYRSKLRRRKAKADREAIHQNRLRPERVELRPSIANVASRAAHLTPDERQWRTRGE
jgi:hypothetical protein